MQVRNSRQITFALGFLAILGFLGGCKKQVATSHSAPAPAPTSAQPTVTLNATPTSVKSGDTVTLSVYRGAKKTDIPVKLGERTGN